MKTKSIRYLVLIFIVCFVSMIGAQNVSSLSDTELINEANKNFEIFSYRKALNAYLELIKRGKENAQILYRTGECYLRLEDSTKAAIYFNRVINEFPKTVYYANANHRLIMSTQHYYSNYQIVLNYAKNVLEYFKKNPALLNDYNKLLDEQLTFVTRSNQRVLQGYIEILKDYIDSFTLDKKQFEKIYYYKGLIYYRVGKETDSLSYSDRQKWMAEAKNFELAQKVWKKLLDKYPDSEYGDKIQYLTANGYNHIGDWVEAVKNYNLLINKYPASQYVSDSKKAIFEISKPVLSMQTARPFLTSEQGEITIGTRNIKNVKLTLHRIDLITLGTRYLQGNANFTLSDFKLQEIKEFPIEKEWIYNTGAKDDYVPVSKKIDVPFKKAGSYFIVAEAENLRGIILYLISDIALITKSDDKKIIGYVTDGKNSKPILNADVILNQPVTDRQYKNTAKTNANGIAIIALQPARTNTQLLIARHGEHFAVSSAYYYWYNYYSSINTTNYAFTDRPVYRPDQNVFIKGFVRMISANVFMPVKDKEIVITVNDSRGQKAHEQKVKLSENGSYDLSFKLKPDASLGWYYLHFISEGYHVSGYRNLGYTPRFRVEEYKRPEYEVNVSTIERSFIIGDKINAKVNAKYYYGQPVNDAATVVEVIKSWAPHNIPYHIIQELYKRYQWRYYQMLSGRKNITAKQAKTNAQGEVFLDFNTEKEDNIPDIARNYIRYNYTITAKVTDASRREINGVHSFNIGLTGFEITAAPERGLYTKGDDARVNIRTATINGLGVSEKIEIKIGKYEYKDEKFNIIPIKTLKGKTDENGIFNIKERINSEGLIIVEARGYDQKQNLVSGQCIFWVVSDKFTGTPYRYKGIEFITDKKVYKPGDKVKLLINTEFKGATFLITVEGNTLYEHRVLKIEGNSKLIEFDVNTNWAPNVFISAVTVLNQKIYSGSEKIIVPPTHQYVTVNLKFPKKEFQPGEKSYVEIETLDWKGKPISSEVTLSIFDKSLLYIQNHVTPDIRSFYYGREVNNSIRTYNSFTFSDNATISQIVLKPDPQFETHAEPSFFGYGTNYYAFGSSRYYHTERSRRMDAESGGAPTASPQAADRDESSEADDGIKLNKRRPSAPGATGEPQAQDVAPVIRADFSETILWKPSIITDSDGKAKVDFKFADSLTTWEVVARAVHAPTIVGQTIENVITTKNIIVRLQSPRFFMERDKCYVSAIAHNYLKTAKNVTISMIIEGGLQTLNETKKTVLIKPGGEHRLDFRVEAKNIGKTTITVFATTDVESDAMKKDFEILPYGSQRFLAWNGDIEKDGAEGARIMNMYLPTERRIDATKLTIVVTPSIAMSMIDALPYLAAYPYGCVEQTISRFVPTVMVKKALVDLGIPQEMLKKKIDTDELDKMVKVGLERLYDFQKSSGGWGWWKTDNDNNLMSAIVVFGLIQAQASGYIVDANRLNRGIEFLKRNVQGEENLHIKAYMLYALSYQNQTNDKALKEVYEKRNNLTVYSMALLALTLKNMNKPNEARILVDNLEDYSNTEGDQTWWGKNSGYYFWYDDAVETTAAVVKAYVNISPNHKMLPKAVRWLVNNRRGANWKSTKDTSAVIFAFIDYIKIKREMFQTYNLNITFNGRTVTKQQLAGYQVLAMNNVYEIPVEWIRDGGNTLIINKSGMGTTYYSVFLDYFSREKKIKKAGNLIHVTRTLRRLKPEVTDEKVVYKHLPWTGNVDSGDIVEIELDLKLENNFDYIMIEDPKPAGCEPLNVQSFTGYYSHVEFRDTKVAMFLAYLSRGEHKFTYRLRAEIPGEFSQMPTRVSSMYVPEFKGTSDSDEVRIIDRSMN